MNQNPKTQSGEFIQFDAAKYLTDDETICHYLRHSLESGDPKEIRAALDDAERALLRNQN